METINVHPSYSSSSADLILLSDDGIKFRVHSIVLAPASRFFRDMFGMPRPAVENNDDALPMGESSEIIKTILDIIYPHDVDPILPSTTFAFLRSLLSAAERFDFIRVNHYLRLLTKAETFTTRLLEVYALACTFGWAKEARALSLQTLNLDLSSPYYADVLKSIDSAALYNLLQLRWKRKQKVLEVATKLEEGRIDDIWVCDCDEGPELAFWNYLKAFVGEEMDNCPDGSGLRSREFWQQGGLDGLWDTKCNTCFGPCVDKSAVRDAFIKVLNDVVTEDMEWKNMGSE
ncbi:hypothetical protein BD410DRAFT_763882 [Rickenella mellea]|uniref:BTB domain-containing protein n=1 Tax=Rickenella mellea TaxID=50990 RepID=A0A4Y7QH84_9AGAM|nr:hypothetical protein BD410DRAFT_763882 [Rickenella mellea]